MTRNGMGRTRGRGVGCIAVVAILVFGLYWVSPLHDPENTGRARSDAGRRAQSLEDALHANFSSPLGGFSRGSENVLDRVADRFGGTLVSVQARTDDGRRDFDVVLSVPGSATPKFSFDAQDVTEVLVCYRYAWQGYVYTITHRIVDCPKGLPQPARGPRPQDDTVDLATRITRRGPSALPGSSSAAGTVDALLREADLPSDTPRSIAARNGIQVFAIGSAHSCVYGVLAPDGTQIWRAPWAGPCTAGSAYAGYALTQWPPIDG
ncbi:hypothetical protein [Streptomyces aureus]|uniref:hypothetical protein n=1 Tax=Streptomyces aureus TaxID=193461 RepID=UPI00131BD91E|nr:hypothetical protein [Streptomyces aureus]